jgi:hypothetical protein
VNQGSPEPDAMRVVLRPHAWRRPEVLAVAAFVPFSIGEWWLSPGPDPGPLWATLLVVALLPATQWPGRAWQAISDREIGCSGSVAVGRERTARWVSLAGGYGGGCLA